MPRIYFTVTNDLSYDQRMQRTCKALQLAGYDITLVGRRMPKSIDINNQPFRQKRLPCLFKKGKLFYLEFNIKLFIYLIFKKMDGICAIDLDTIIPCYFISIIKRIPRIYDAHELFCEMKEVISRPRIYRIWKWIENKTVPHFINGYTVNQLIAEEFKSMYGLNYEVIQNMPSPIQATDSVHEKFILYQGAVNEGRCFETLIPAMKNVNAQLLICGDGNFMEQAQKLVSDHQVANKVSFKGMIAPDKLVHYTSRAYIGITLFEKEARSNFYSLANRFFDYIQSGVPQLCVSYPLYNQINDQYDIAVMIDEPNEVQIAQQLNFLLQDTARWQQLHTNCIKAAKELNWQKEEIKLLTFYNKIFGKPSPHNNT